jgi:hypothetical protein
MKIKFQKQTENYEFATFDEYRVIEDLEFCCYRFHILDSESSLWNKKSGKFCWIGVNSQDEPIYYPIDFCPFCGERFDYEEV